MDRIYSSQQKPFSEIRAVAIAIVEFDGDQRHTGLLHRDSESGPVLMLELQWHHRLRNDTADDAFLWIDPAVHETRLAHVGDICRLVWRANQRNGIPYGFSPPTDCFDDETCEWLLGPTGFGLTCATFVLAVFHRAGLPLVAYASWPQDRPDDRAWRDRIVPLLERTGAEPEHVDALRNDTNAARFRPEEVAAAATVSAFPAEFDSVREPSERILARLRQDRR